MVIRPLARPHPNAPTQEPENHMWQEIKQLKEDRAQKVADMKALTAKANDEKRDMTADEEQRFDALGDEAEGLKSKLDRLERLYSLERDAESAREGEDGQAQGEQRAGRGDVKQRDFRGGSNPDEQRAKEVRKQVNAYLRYGEIPASAEMRSVTVSGMGIVGDRPLYDQLVISLKNYAGVRQAGAQVVVTTDGNPMNVPTANDTSNTGQIVGEAATDNTAADPTMDTVELSPVKFDSKWIKVSFEMLQDNAFDLEQYILREAGERIGRAFNTYSTTGTGTAQPQGVVTGAGVGKVAASTSAITYEELLDLYHSVDASYRNMPSFRLMFHDTTLAAIRKLKDGDGRYIFAAGAAGAPATVLDTPYVVNNDMAELSDGADSSVVLAGDFSRYMVRDVSQPVIIRATELFSGDGLVGFRVFSRHDGRVVDASAFKTLDLDDGA